MPDLGGLLGECGGVCPTLAFFSGNAAGLLTLEVPFVDVGVYPTSDISSGGRDC